MKLYEMLDGKLCGRCKTSRKLSNHTYAIRRNEKAIAIRLHETDIITAQADGTITATTGGWKTHTTKDRLNQYLPVQIWQRRGCWYLNQNGSKIEFQDGITFHPDGTITGHKPQSEAKAEKQLRKRIAAYCKRLQEALPLPMPGNGDCFYCVMRTVEDGKPLGESVENVDHLETHLEENYFVPSLVWRAIEHAGCKPDGNGCAWFAFAFSKDQQLGDWQKSQIAKFVRKYMHRQFKLA